MGGNPTQSNSPVGQVYDILVNVKFYVLDLSICS